MRTIPCGQPPRAAPLLLLPEQRPPALARPAAQRQPVAHMSNPRLNLCHCVLLNLKRLLHELVLNPQLQLSHHCGQYALASIRAQWSGRRRLRDQRHRWHRVYQGSAVAAAGPGQQPRLPPLHQSDQGSSIPIRWPLAGAATAVHASWSAVQPASPSASSMATRGV